MRILVAIALVALTATAVRADDPVEGEDGWIGRPTDRTKPRPPKTEAPKPTPAAAPAQLPPHELTHESRLAALRKAARDGLEQRGRFQVGARALTTYVPLRAEGNTFVLSPRPQAIDLDQALYVDRLVEDVAYDLWNKRAGTDEERYRALKAVAGCVCWVEADVQRVEASGTDTDVSIQFSSRVMRAKTKVRLPGRANLQPGACLKLAVVLLVKQEEGSTFLAQKGNDSVSSWPMDFVPLMGEVGAATGPHTVSPNQPERVAEHALGERVRDWLTLRTRILCHNCNGTRQCVCPACDGKGGCMKLYLAVMDAHDEVRWCPCARCGGTGVHPCQGCVDGLSDPHMKESLKQFGTYGKPLASFLGEGQTITLDADGHGATVTTWVREKPNDPPRPDVSRWRFDDKNGWRPAESPR